MEYHLIVNRNGDDFNPNVRGSGRYFYRNYEYIHIGALTFLCEEFKDENTCYYVFNPYRHVINNRGSHYSSRENKKEENRLYITNMRQNENGIYVSLQLNDQEIEVGPYQCRIVNQWMIFRDKSIEFMLASDNGIKTVTTIGNNRILSGVIPIEYDHAIAILENNNSIISLSQVDAMKFAMRKIMELERKVERDLSGVKSSRSRIDDFLSELAEINPLYHSIYEWLPVNRTINKIKLNSYLKGFYDTVKSVDDLVSNMDQVFEQLADKNIKNEVPYFKHYIKDVRGLIYQLFPTSNKIRTEKNEKIIWYTQNSNEKKADALGIDQENYPLLREKVINGNIPFTIFHKSGRQNEIANDEFPLWEAALQQDGWAEQVCEIARVAARRTHYARPITHYFLYLLVQIPNYLSRVTGETWRCLPKLVDSTSGMEMRDQAEGETVKTRSIMTPIADNENKTLTVPYISIRTGDISNYTQHIHLSAFGEEDISEGIFLKDFEKALNGKDDYGLMAYTLSGSGGAGGYPTFLIILERFENGKTKVHFHRVHPCRKRGVDGSSTSTQEIIKECYRYMAGNIPAAEVLYQQGDLIFVEAKNKIGSNTKTALLSSYEGHTFTEPVMLNEDRTPNSNFLCHIKIEEDTSLTHTEHQSFRVKAGEYYIYRCKTWEANPTGSFRYFHD